MDVLVLISNCPQLNNPCNAYNPTPVRVLIWDVPDADAGHPSPARGTTSLTTPCSTRS